MAVNKGVPITLASPGHPVSKAIAGFARQYLLPEPAKKGGLFGRGRRQS
jgi:hypothetical protein